MWDAIKRAIVSLLRSPGFRTWLITALVPIIIKSLSKLWPALAWPGVGWIASWAVNKAVEFLYLVSQMKAIDLKTDDEVKQYNEAISQLRIMLNKPDATKEEIDAAIKEARRRVDELLDFSRLRRD